MYLGSYVVEASLKVLILLTFPSVAKLHRLQVIHPQTAPPTVGMSLGGYISHSSYSIPPLL